MKKLLLLFFLLMSILSAKTIECQSVDSKIVVDGSKSDWKEYVYRYDSDHVVLMATAMSEDSLYVMISLSGSDMRKLRANDATLWIDSKGGRRKKIGLKYTIPFQLPMGDEERSGSGFDGQRGGYQQSGMMQQGGSGQRKGQDFDFRQLDPEFMLTQLRFGDWLLDDGSDYESGLSEKRQGVKTAVGYENYQIVFEYAVPLESDNKKYVALNSEKKAVRVGFEFGGLSDEIQKEMESKRASMQGQGGQGQGQRPSGGGGGGMSGGGALGGASSSMQTSSVTIWSDRLSLK